MHVLISNGRQKKWTALKRNCNHRYNIKLKGLETPNYFLFRGLFHCYVITSLLQSLRPEIETNASIVRKSFSLVLEETPSSQCTCSLYNSLICRSSSSVVHLSMGTGLYPVCYLLQCIAVALENYFPIPCKVSCPCTYTPI